MYLRIALALTSSCTPGSPVCTIIPEIYLRDHFLAVSSTTLWFHSSLRNTFIGIGGQDWSFDAVTFFLHSPLRSHHVTLLNSKVL